MFMHNHRAFRYYIVLCCSSVLLLIFSFGMILTANASGSRKQLPSRLALPGSQPTCPDPRPNQNVGPTLDFCSPEYDGNINGPFGSYIVLVGENFPASSAHWLLTTTTNIDQQTVQKCVAKATDSCYPLPTPSGKNTSGASVAFYSWTWASNAFPSKPDDYFMVAVFGGGSNISFVESPVSFTLTSSQLPCIAVQALPGNCKQPQTVSLNAGSSFSLVGSQWLLEGASKLPPSLTPPAQQVTITINCAQSFQCNSSQLVNPITISLGSNGSFNRPVSLLQDASGTYDVCASNQVPQSLPDPSDPGIDFNTVANGALAFGTCSGTGTSLRLTIKSSNPSPIATQATIPVPHPTPPGPGPSPSDNSVSGHTLDVLSYIGAFILLIAIALYFFMERVRLN
jgi:hypothetical protein